MRGYFGIGAERISKPMNFGAILRTAHAFGASFAFTVNAHANARERNMSDTAKSTGHVPLFEWDEIGALQLPKACALVGVELDENASILPSYRNPTNCAYILGPEKGSLSPEAIARCDFLVRIPTQFCVNLSIAAALVMYDRTISFGGFGDRPVRPGGAPPPAEWAVVAEKTRN